jgi:hypothetical protein
MRKPILFIIIFVSLLISACGTPNSTPTAKKLIPLTPITTTSFQSLCQKISLEPTPDTKDSSLFPVVGEEDFVLGPKTAAMTIIEYGDFQ